jgi:hypothetical protein
MRSKTIKVTQPIPFYSQAVWSYEAQGFRSSADAEYWRRRGCGIICIKMIIDGFMRDKRAPLSPTYGELLYSCLARGGYCSRGWIHAKLVEMADDFGIRGCTFRSASPNDIVAELQRNRPCIASVTRGFVGGQLRADNRIIPPGGHLAVVTGCLLTSDALCGFIVNHPSSFPAYNWEQKTIPLSAFVASFSGAFMSFWSDDQCELEARPAVDHRRILR